MLSIELGREIPQAVLAASHERDAMTAPGELARDLRADAGGGSGDKRGRAGVGGGKRHAGRLSEALGRPRHLSMLNHMEGSEGFNIFGDPDELRSRLGELAEQMQGAQRVAWADNAIKLAVDMTVAAINRLELSGSSDEQAMQVRDAIRIVFPESVTLVREAREGLGS
jgi:hypothetical protein